MSWGRDLGRSLLLSALLVACGGGSPGNEDSGIQPDLQVDQETTNADTGPRPDLVLTDADAATVDIPVDEGVPDPGPSIDQADLPVVSDVDVATADPGTPDPGPPDTPSVPDGSDVQDVPAPPDLTVDPGAPPTDDGGTSDGPILGYIEGGYYIIDFKKKVYW